MTTSSGIPGAPGIHRLRSPPPLSKQPRRFRGLVVGGALAAAALVGVGASVGGIGTTTITGTAVAASAAGTDVAAGLPLGSGTSPGSNGSGSTGGGWPVTPPFGSNEDGQGLDRAEGLLRVGAGRCQRRPADRHRRHRHRAGLRGRRGRRHRDGAHRRRRDPDQQSRDRGLDQHHGDDRLQWRAVIPATVVGTDVDRRHCRAAAFRGVGPGHRELRRRSRTWRSATPSPASAMPAATAAPHRRRRGTVTALNQTITTQAESGAAPKPCTG